jgi:hypothetical protein
MEMTTYTKYRILLFSLELTDGKFSKMAAAPLRRVGERAVMQGFKSVGSAQRFLSTHAMMRLAPKQFSGPACRSSKEPRPLSHKTLFA